MLFFKPVTDYRRGLLASLLHQCYAELLLDESSFWRQEEDKWLQFDNEVFDNPETIGQCVFVTCFSEQEVGFGSFDPRQRPELGIIGHNCVLPRFRGRGFGSRQIIEILDRFRRMQIKRAKVVASCHPFYAAARKMYLGCGLSETGRMIGGQDPRYELVQYEMDL
jgi:RimJ/RimL family protein N-acetyltransferase